MNITGGKTLNQETLNWFLLQTVTTLKNSIQSIKFYKMSIKVNANKNVTFHTQVGYCWCYSYFLRNEKQEPHGFLFPHV